MKKLINTLIAVSLLGAFAVPAFASEDLVSTDGAICNERQAGKDIKSEQGKKEQAESNTAKQD